MLLQRRGPIPQQTDTTIDVTSTGHLDPRAHGGPVHQHVRAADNRLFLSLQTLRSKTRRLPEAVGWRDRDEPEAVTAASGLKELAAIRQDVERRAAEAPSVADAARWLLAALGEIANSAADASTPESVFGEAPPTAISGLLAPSELRFIHACTRTALGRET